MEAVTGVGVIALVGFCYWMTWRHSLRLSAAYGRPRWMALTFAVISTAFMCWVWPYWTVRTLLVGSALLGRDTSRDPRYF